MKIVHGESSSVVRPLSSLLLGATVINGQGNLCLVARSDQSGKVRLVNLSNGGTYHVNENCRHEEVDATVTWKYKEAV